MAFGSILVEDVMDENGQPLVSVKVMMSSDFDVKSNAHQQIALIVKHLDMINEHQPASSEPLLKLEEALKD